LGLDPLLRIIRQIQTETFEDITQIRVGNAGSKLAAQGVRFYKLFGEFPEMGLHLRPNHTIAVRIVYMSIEIIPCKY
jgi:hypothetical protein